MFFKGIRHIVNRRWYVWGVSVDFTTIRLDDWRQLFSAKEMPVGFRLSGETHLNIVASYLWRQDVHVLTEHWLYPCTFVCVFCIWKTYIDNFHRSINNMFKFWGLAMKPMRSLSLLSYPPETRCVCETKCPPIWCLTL